MSDSSDRYPPEIEGLADTQKNNPVDLSVLDGLVERARIDAGEPFKPEVVRALAHLRAHDPAEHERIWADLRKVGIRLRPLEKEIRKLNFRVIQGGEDADGDSVERAGPYSVHDGVTVYNKPTADGSTKQTLSNFAAHIVCEEIRDDGAERTLCFRIEGVRQGGISLPPIAIPADKFESLSWVLAEWGTPAVISAGFVIKSHLRTAIQMFSGIPPRQTIHTNIGWQKIDDEWAYLHAGGAIGPNGPVSDVLVDPPKPLSLYDMPDPAEGEEARQAVRASLRLSGVAPDRVVFPSLAATYRAPLGEADFSLHYSGHTGVGKTEVAALSQSHFGPGLDARHLPGSWSSTGNSLEGLAFLAKDAVLVVDDFAPHGTIYDVQRVHSGADRLLRAQGNRSGRGRMRRDISLSQPRPPRGLILSTGEDVPAGQSLRARILVIELSPTDLNWNLLTDCQKDAKDGLYAVSTATYLQWLAPQHDEFPNIIRHFVDQWRKRSLAHRRSSDILGQLAAAFNLFLDFAVETEALSPAEADKLRDRAEKALLAIGAEQAQYQRADDPATRFLNLLAGAFVSGEAHVADLETGKEPRDGDGEAWGWSRRFEGQSENEKEIWTPKGRQIGWIRHDDLFLEPEAAYACIQQLGSRQGASLSIGQTTLWKRLDEGGLIVSHDEGRLTKRIVTAAGRKRVIHLRAEVLSRESGPIGPPGPHPAKPDGERTTAQEDCEPWPNNRPTSGPTAPTSGHERSDGVTSGPVGPLSKGEKQTDGENSGDIDEGWV